MNILNNAFARAQSRAMESITNIAVPPLATLRYSLDPSAWGGGGSAFLKQVYESRTGDGLRTPGAQKVLRNVALGAAGAGVVGLGLAAHRIYRRRKAGAAPPRRKHRRRSD